MDQSAGTEVWVLRGGVSAADWSWPPAHGSAARHECHPTEERQEEFWEDAEGKYELKSSFSLRGPQSWDLTAVTQQNAAHSKGCASAGEFCFPQYFQGTWRKPKLLTVYSGSSQVVDEFQEPSSQYWHTPFQNPEWQKVQRQTAYPEHGLCQTSRQTPDDHHPPNENQQEVHQHRSRPQRMSSIRQKHICAYVDNREFCFILSKKNEKILKWWDNGTQFIAAKSLKCLIFYSLVLFREDPW